MGYCRFLARAYRYRVPLRQCCYRDEKPIGDKAAITFAAQFYSSIGFGKSIKTAYEQAKASLMLEGINKEDTPELYDKSELSSDEIYLIQPG